MNIFSLDKNYDPVNFADISAEDLTIISGGSGSESSYAIGWSQYSTSPLFTSQPTTIGWGPYTFVTYQYYG